MIIPYVMYQSGPIPGQEGMFAGGQTVLVDDVTNTVVDTSPIQQEPHIADDRNVTQPLAEDYSNQPLEIEAGQPLPDPSEGAQ